MTINDALGAAAAAVAALTHDDHLAPPGTVIVTDDHITNLPEDRRTPILSLLSWAEHLDGAVRYDASIMWEGNDAPTSVQAHGTLDGIPVTIGAATSRVMPILLEHPNPWERVPVAYLNVVELSSTEDALAD